MTYVCLFSGAGFLVQKPVVDDLDGHDHGGVAVGVVLRKFQEG